MAAQLPASNPPLAVGSPPQHQALEYVKRSPKASKKQRPRSSGDVSALLRKLTRPSSQKSTDGDSTSRSAESGNDASACHATYLGIRFTILFWLTCI